jgi:hypothetical protein
LDQDQILSLAITAGDIEMENGAIDLGFSLKRIITLPSKIITKKSIWV